MTKKLQEKTPEPASPERAKKANQSTNAKKGPSAGSAVRKHNPQSKSDHVLALLRQADGASLNDLMKATRWQAHSVRGFLSGAVRKRKGLTVVSERDGQGTRRYRIAGEAGA